jgi:hypothetical protein
MTMIHHQTHTTTARARLCVECHRAPATFGRGSANFRLTRDFIVTGGDLGVRILSLDRKTPGDTALLSALPVPQVRAMTTTTGRVTGRCEWTYAASLAEGLVTCDVSSPGFPRITSRDKDAAKDPQALVAAASRLYLADGENGVSIFDIATPSKPRLVARVAEVPAYGLWLDGPTLHVAAGSRGLAAIDVRDARAPRVIRGGFDLNGEDTASVTPTTIAGLFQYSRPNANVLEAPRTTPRALAVVGTRDASVWLVDVTEPAAPVVLAPLANARRNRVEVFDVAVATLYELGSEGGAIPSDERDVAFVLFQEGGARLLLTLDVTDPAQSKFRGILGLNGQTRAIRVARVYNPPFLQTFVVAVGALGTQIVDVTKPDAPAIVATLNLPLNGYALDVEEFPLDRTVDADGKPIMDVSHDGARWLDAGELQRVLDVPSIWSLREPPVKPKEGKKR